MDLGSFIAAGGIAVFVAVLAGVAVTVGVMVLGLWLTYTVIWRSVRRGMREFYAERRPLGSALYPPNDSWSLAGGPREAPSRTEPIRRDQGPRDW